MHSILFIVCINLLLFDQIRAPGTSSSSFKLKTRRTQSMGPLGRQSVNRGHLPLRSSSRSSSSMSSSASLKESKQEQFHEIKLHPIDAGDAAAASTSGISFTSPVGRTIRDFHLNPDTDGVYATSRMRAMHRYGMVIASSAAIGTGGFFVGQHFAGQRDTNLSSAIDITASTDSTDTISSTTMSTTTITSETTSMKSSSTINNIISDDADGISNPIG